MKMYYFQSTFYMQNIMTIMKTLMYILKFSELKHNFICSSTAVLSS